MVLNTSALIAILSAEPGKDFSQTNIQAAVLP